MAAKRKKKATPLRQTNDGWESTITGLGTARDKRYATRIKYAGVEGSRDRFDAYYHGDDTSATIAELPAVEMTRRWIELHVDDSARDEGRNEEASAADKMLTAKQVMQSLEDIGAQYVFAEALLWARVHGGAMVFVGVDDGVEDLTEPLNLDAIRNVDFLTVYDRWDLQVQTTYTDMASPQFGLPEVYLLQPQTSTGVGAVTATMVHESRFIRFDGTITSRYRQAHNSGWADSIYTRMEETLRDYGISWGGIAHLLQDFSQAVLKMRGLADALAQDEEGLVINRMTAMDLCRSVARAIPIDAESEDFMRVATPMTGLPETIDRLMLRVSSAARIPATLLFGQSPAGLNATGESDIRLFYDHISAEQERILRPRIDRLLDILFASKGGPTRGTEPENWSYDFLPLWQSTDKEKAEVRKLQSETDQIYLQNSVLDPDEVAQSRFGGDAYSTETVLDTETREAVMVPDAPDDMGDEPVEPAGPDAAAEPSQTLNGAQIKALMDIITAVTTGDIPKDAAIQLVLASVPLDLPRVQAMFASVEEGEKREPPPMPPQFTQQPPPQPPQGDDDDEQDT